MISRCGLHVCARKAQPDLNSKKPDSTFSKKYLGIIRFLHMHHGKSSAKFLGSTTVNTRVYKQCLNGIVPAKMIILTLFIHPRKVCFKMFDICLKEIPENPASLKWFLAGQRGLLVGLGMLFNVYTSVLFINVLNQLLFLQLIKMYIFIQVLVILLCAFVILISFLFNFFL